MKLLARTPVLALSVLLLAAPVQGRQILPETPVVVSTGPNNIKSFYIEGVGEIIKVVYASETAMPGVLQTDSVKWVSPSKAWPEKAHNDKTSDILPNPNVCSIAKQIKFGGPKLDTDFIAVVEEGDKDVTLYQLPDGLDQTEVSFQMTEEIRQLSIVCSAVDCDGDSDIDENDITVYVLMRTNNGSVDRAFLTRRLGQGAFETPVLVSDGLKDIDEISLVAKGSEIILGWSEDDGSGAPDPYVLRKQSRNNCDPVSTAATTDTLTGVGISDFRAKYRGSVGEVVYTKKAAGGNDSLRSTVSIDDCVTWGPEVQVGNTPPADDVDDPDAGILPSGALVVTWADDRFGADSIFTAVSTDNGANWTETLQGAGTQPGLIVGEGTTHVAVHWIDGTTSELMSALSTDDGQTWSSSASLSAGAAVIEAGGVYEECYERFSLVWLADLGGVQSLFSGGFRAQTSTPVNMTAGATNVGFDYTNFQPGTGALVALSTLPPQSFVISPKDWGLFPNVSLTLFPLLIVDGNGEAMFRVPGPLPPIPGITLYTIGVGFDFSPAIVTLTSVVEFTL